MSRVFIEAGGLSADRGDREKPMAILREGDGGGWHLVAVCVDNETATAIVKALGGMIDVDFGGGDTRKYPVFLRECIVGDNP